MRVQANQMSRGLTGYIKLEQCLLTMSWHHSMKGVSQTLRSVALTNSVKEDMI